MAIDLQIKNFPGFTGAKPHEIKTRFKLDPNMNLRRVRPSQHDPCHAAFEEIKHVLKLLQREHVCEADLLVGLTEGLHITIGLIFAPDRYNFDRLKHDFVPRLITCAREVAQRFPTAICTARYQQSLSLANVP